MIRIKYSINFNLHRRQRADGTFAIRLTVRWNGNRIYFNLPLGVFEDQWDSYSMTAHPTRQHKDVASVNKMIIKYQNELTDLFDKAAFDDRIPTEEEVRSIVSPGAKSTNARETDGGSGDKGNSPASEPGVETGEPKQDKETDGKKKKEDGRHPIPLLIQKFAQTQSTERGWAPITGRKFVILDRELKAAGLKYIEEMDSEGIQRYMKWITDRKYENAVAMKKVSIMRWFLGWCRREGYLKSDDYMIRGLHLKCPQKVVIYLKWEELLQMYYFNYGSHYALSNVRDVFCFCAFTGLRFSDAKKLKWDDVYSDHINVVTQKTADTLSIELNKYSKGIIDRCAERNKHFPSKYVLPAVSIQKSNEHLKDCAMLAQIDEKIRIVSFRGSEREEKVYLKWEVLTTHCARRTFVVNALRLGIPAEVIMKWTGHSDFKAMRPYVDIVDEVKKENMAKFNVD